MKYVSYKSLKIHIWLILCTISTVFSQTSLVFEDIDGIVCIEAEHYKSADGSFVLGKDIEDRKGFSGDNWVYGDDQPSNIYFDFKINVSGRYFLFSRTYSTGHGDNGFMVYIDGKKNKGDKMYLAKSKRWDWENHIQGDGPVPSWELDTGMHELKYAMRDNFHRVDKIVLLNEAMFVIPTHETDGKFLRPKWDFDDLGPNETIMSTVSIQYDIISRLKPNSFTETNQFKIFTLNGSSIKLSSSLRRSHGFYIVFQEINKAQKISIPYKVKH